MDNNRWHHFRTKNLHGLLTDLTNNGIVPSNILIAYVGNEGRDIGDFSRYPIYDVHYYGETVLGELEREATNV